MAKKAKTKGDLKVAYCGFGMTVIFVDEDGNWHPQTFGAGYTNIPRRAVTRFEEEALKRAPAIMRALKPLMALGVKMGYENIAEPMRPLAASSK